jgi:hypothetical protein
MSRFVVGTLSKVQSDKFTTLGFDLRGGLVCNIDELDGLKALSVRLNLPPFDRQLTKILVRCEPHTRRGLAYGLQARMVCETLFQERILEIEDLPYERRSEVRDITDDVVGPLDTVQNISRG